MRPSGADLPLFLRIGSSARINETRSWCVSHPIGGTSLNKLAILCAKLENLLYLINAHVPFFGCLFSVSLEHYE